MMTVLTLMPAIIPFGRGTGHKTEKILTDGVTFYCAQPGCPYTGDRFARVFAHRGVHSTKPKKNDSATKAQIRALTGLREQAAGLVRALDEISTTQDSGISEKKYEAMRQRALAAERKLASLKRVFS